MLPLQIQTGSMLETLIQAGGTIAVLAFFLRYFMSEQKELRQKMDANTIKYESELKELRKVYDDKIDGVIRQMAENNGRMTSALNDWKISNEHLTSAVNSLTEKIDYR